MSDKITVVQCDSYPPIPLLLLNTFRDFRPCNMSKRKLFNQSSHINSNIRNRMHHCVNPLLGTIKLRKRCARLLRAIHSAAILEFHQGRTEFGPGSSRPHCHASDSTSQPFAAGCTALRPRWPRCHFAIHWNFANETVRQTGLTIKYFIRQISGSSADKSRIWWTFFVYRVNSHSDGLLNSFANIFFETPVWIIAFFFRCGEILSFVYSSLGNWMYTACKYCALLY